MRTRNLVIILAGTGLLILGLLSSACSIVSPTPIPTPTQQAVPTLSLNQTSIKEFTIRDFDAVHSPVSEDKNQSLIFGNIPVRKPEADLAPELTAFLGRWEGYSYAPPVKKDRKLVLVISEINALEGTVYGWSGTNLQFPDVVGDVHFRVTTGESPAIGWQITWPDGTKEIDTFTYDPQKDMLIGWSKSPDTNETSGPYELTKEKSFYVYKDYPAYLESKRIYARDYKDQSLKQYGKGYMVYLPEGYETDTSKTWPLLFFLHGYGDRGDNLFVLPKASPFMYIREKGPLPFIIVAPLLNTEHTLFPDEYMTRALDDALANYRVDKKRIYLTGMSMGGEAAYRFTINQPDTFAAVSPLCAYLLGNTDLASLDKTKGLPIWAIHGADDQVVALSRGQSAVDAFKKAGADIRFSILPEHDHDVWTDTYSDLKFYQWFMQYQKP